MTRPARWRAARRAPYHRRTCGLSRSLAMPAVRPLIAALLVLARGFCPLLGMGADWPIAASPSPQAPRLVQPADYRPAALKPTEVRLTFVGHATWLIESPGAVKIATDYNDYVRPPGGARHRHHEPGAHLALLQLPRPRHQARAARLEPRRRARQARPDGRRRARAQRRHQHPRLGRRLRSPTATPSSSSRSPACASAISATCITR